MKYAMSVKLADLLDFDIKSISMVLYTRMAIQNLPNTCPIMDTHLAP